MMLTLQLPSVTRYLLYTLVPLHFSYFTLHVRYVTCQVLCTLAPLQVAYFTNSSLYFTRSFRSKLLTLQAAAERDAREQLRGAQLQAAAVKHELQVNYLSA